MLPVVFPDSGTVWVFCLTALTLLVIPGPAVLYVVVQGVEQGRRVGLAAVAGIHLGTLVHVAAATAGLSALIVTSAVAFSAVKYVGAAYLIYIGVRKLLGRDDPSFEPGEQRISYRRAFVRGAVVNVLNPKTALFFLALLPQFVDPDRGGVWSQALLLGLLFACLGSVTDSAYTLAAGTVGGVLRRRRRGLRYGSGLVFVGLGAVAAFAKRN
jgi:threonine/homoserine/homoserine lactone efflux protein